MTDARSISEHRDRGWLGVAAAHVRELAATYSARQPCEFEVLLQKYPPRVKRQALELLRAALKLSGK